MIILNKLMKLLNYNQALLRKALPPFVSNVPDRGSFSSSTPFSLTRAND